MQNFTAVLSLCIAKCEICIKIMILYIIFLTFVVDFLSGFVASATKEQIEAAHSLLSKLKDLSKWSQWRIDMGEKVFQVGRRMMCCFNLYLWGCVWDVGLTSLKPALGYCLQFCSVQPLELFCGVLASTTTKRKRGFILHCAVFCCRFLKQNSATHIVHVVYHRGVYQ